MRDDQREDARSTDDLAERLLRAISLVREGAKTKGMGAFLSPTGGGTIEPFGTAGLSPGRLGFGFEPGFGLRFHLTVPIRNHSARSPLDPHQTAARVIEMMLRLRDQAGTIAAVRSGILSAVRDFLREASGEVEMLSIDPGPVDIAIEGPIKNAWSPYFRVVMLYPGPPGEVSAREAYVIEAEDAQTFSRRARG